MRPTSATIDLGAIARNYRRMADRLGRERVLFCVVKGDAYGHGAAKVSQRLASEGAGAFAVAVAEEGVALRRAGIAGDILLLNFSDPADAGLHRAYRLTPTLYDSGQALAFARATRKFTPPLPVHLKLDTGMGRIGFRPDEVGSLAALLREAPGLAVAGTFTNLAAAEDLESRQTPRQIETLRSCVGAMAAAGVRPGLVHVANSAGVLFHPDARFDGARPGLALYGISPSETADAGAGLEPAMTLETRVMAVKDVPAGTALGYGGRFVTSRASTIVTLPIGYHDGFRRSFSGRVRVLLRGNELPVVGAVSMDLTLVDATGVGARPGESVVCLGADGAARVSAWDLARAAETIPYEVLCGIGSRVPRVYTG